MFFCTKVNNYIVEAEPQVQNIAQISSRRLGIWYVWDHQHTRPQMTTQFTTNSRHRNKPGSLLSCNY